MNMNTECIKEALEGLGLSFQTITNHPDAIYVSALKESFISSSTPFNTESTMRLLRDKYFTYTILGGNIRQPKTKGFFDPRRIEWSHFVKERSLEEIMDSIELEFSFPLIIKRNNGSLGNNVYFVKDRKSGIVSLKKIFKDSRNYDFLALAQVYIEPANEFTAMFADGKLEFVYEKPMVEDVPKNGVHIADWRRVKAEEVTDESILSRTDDFCRPIWNTLKVGWCATDIVEDRSGKLWLIEINSAPRFDYFVEGNGKKKVVDIYTKTIRKLMKK